MKLYFILLLLFFEETSGFHETKLRPKIVNVSETLTIECGHPNLNTTVTLKKDGIDITNDARIMYDYKKGFSIENVTKKDGGFYICETGEEWLSKRVKVIDRTLAPPSIETGKNQHFVKGESFTLECLKLRTDNFEFEWKYPNDKVEHEQIYDNEMRNNHWYLVSILQITNASSSDTGIYTCIIKTVDNSLSNYATKYIYVEERITPYVIINALENINITEGKDFKWKAEVLFYPGPPVIKYTNWRGQEINETDRISFEFKDNSVAWLTITNITSSDFGNYNLTVTTHDGTAQNTSTLSLHVENVPHIKMKDVQRVVSRKEKQNATCLAEGFPKVNVSLLFQSCFSRNESSCETSFSHLGVNKKYFYPAPGNIAVKSVSFFPPASGFLHCHASNSKGSEDKKVEIRISDIGDDFVLQLWVNDKITQPEDHKNLVTIVENDNFSLMCAGLKYDYKDVILAVDLQSDSSMISYKNNSEISWITSIRSTKATKTLIGNYTCTAYPHEEKQPLTMSIAINVIKEKKVHFRNDTNMKNQTMEMEVNKPFTLTCNITGTPTPTIQWMKDKKNLTTGSASFDSDSMNFSHDSKELKFKPFIKSHEGKYTCIAKNRLNKVMTSLTLKMSVPGLSMSVKLGLILPLLGIAVLAIAVVFLMNRVRREQKIRKSFKVLARDLFEAGNIKSLNPACTADTQADMLPYDKTKWEISRENITLGKQLGSGAFGRVIKAKVSNLEGPGTTTVAVKMCRDVTDTSQIHALISELKIMMHLGKHLNIVNLLGASTVQINSGELWIVVEYCHFGNLLDFIQRHRRKFTNQICPSTGELIPPHSSWSPTSSESYPRTSCYQDDYLTPIAPKLILSDPPLGHSGGTTFVPSSRSSIPVNQVASNPMYTMDIAALTEDPKAEPKGKEETKESRNCQRKCSVALSTNSSISQQPRGRDTSLTTHMEQSPHPPLSPTDTYFAGENPVDFMLERGNIPAINATFSTFDLICWGWQMAQGMNYLSERKILHGDLAARNLLLADKNVVKISDFGLSRNMYKNDDYIKKGGDLLPVKWMSIEAIRDRIFSIESDVWAFGISLWEIFSLGSTPYPSVEIGPDFLEQLENGYRMSCPKYANQEIYQIMKQCWEGCPQNRPSFSHLVDHLGHMISDITEEYLSQNEVYMQMNAERFREETDYLSMMANPSFENWTKPEEVNDQLDETNYLNVAASPNSESTTTVDCVHHANVPNQTRKSNSIGCEFSPTVAWSATSPSSFSNLSPVENNYLPMVSRNLQNSPNDVICSPQEETSRFIFPSNNSERSRSTTSGKEKKPLLEPEQPLQISTTRPPSLEENLSLERENEFVENKKNIDSNYVNL